MENIIKRIIKQFSDIVQFIEKLELSEEGHVSKLKVKLKLFDGSVLWIREVRLKNKIDAYSYYWLRSDETLIMGWDNAPHHKEMQSFPHHKHIGNKIESSKEMDVEKVLNFIKTFLG